jgi:hypothetical protein
MKEAHYMTSETPVPPATPPRLTIAAYRDYAAAEQAVDYLSDSKFPVEHVAIVGRGLSFYETVTGRMTYARAALFGAMQGALVGVMIGWLFAVFDWFSPVVASGWLIVDGLWFGALVGALLGLLAHALTFGRRDFSSITGMRADRYELQVDADLAAEAQRLLARMPADPAVAIGRGARPPRVRMPHMSR